MNSLYLKIFRNTYQTTLENSVLSVQVEIQWILCQVMVITTRCSFSLPNNVASDIWSINYSMDIGYQAHLLSVCHQWQHCALSYPWNFSLACFIKSVDFSIEKPGLVTTHHNKWQLEKEDCICIMIIWTRIQPRLHRTYEGIGTVMLVLLISSLKAHKNE